MLCLVTRPYVLYVFDSSTFESFNWAHLMDMVHLTPVARGVFQFHVVHDSFRNLLVYLFTSKFVV